MRLLIAVVEDLFSFAVEALFGRGPVAAVAHGEGADTSVITLGGETTSRALSPAPSRSLASYQQTHTPVAPKNTVMYSASIDVPLRAEPHDNTDNVFTTLPYGAMVMVLDTRGEWAHVVSGDKDGWVAAQDLADRAAHVYPQFVVDGTNAADDPNTVRLRAMINDAFGHGAAELPLQAEEYVLYKLRRRNVTVHWPEAGPQLPGEWSATLGRAGEVVISGTPKNGAVVEYLPNGTTMHGHLAYVEAVFPDESIQISEVNGLDNGIYGERILTREEYGAEDIIFLHFAS